MKIHHKILIILFLLISLFSSALPGDAIESEAHKPDKLRVACGDKFQPMIFIDANNEPVGIHVDVWKLWEERTGVPVEFHLTDWNKAIPMLLEGEADVVHGVSYTSERAEVLDFSEPLQILYSYIYYHESLKGIDGLENLAGYPVGVLSGSKVEELVRKNAPDIKIVGFSDYEEMAVAASQGTIKVLIGEEVLMQYFLAKAGSVEVFRRSEEYIHQCDIRIAVRKGDRETLALVEDGLSKISEKEIKEISDKWTGGVLKKRFPWKLFWTGILAVAIVLLFLLAWNNMLRQRVNSATRALQTSESKYHSLFDSAGDAIFLMDEDLLIDCNDRALEMFKCTREQLLGKSIYDFSGEKQADNIDSREIGNLKIKAAREGETQVFEWLHRRYDGTMFDAEASLNNLELSSGSHIQAIIRDVSERKKAEKELAGYREHLEELVDQRTQQLQLAQEKIVAAEKLAVLGQFAGSLAHEIRNPLGAISNAAYYLKRKIDTDDEKVLRFINMMGTRTRDMARIIESITNLTMLEAPRKEKHSPEDFISRIRDYSRSELKTIVHDENISIECDFDQMFIVLKNLVRNADQAMDGKGTITLEFCKAEGKAIVKVTDTGTGMAPEEVVKIFDPLYSTKVYGMGFGLSIVKMIVEKHGGAVSAVSEPGKKTVFTIELPMEDA